ncbi:DUF6042 family protein [Embleya sp. NPDC050154]|uniref:DUF6042 family protein n=1 Tax=Embleya sp. NPDC050154 TaxID=3363988 RepID=UPI003793156C
MLAGSTTRRNGWERVLPRQVMWLQMVVSTATVEGLEGDLDTVVGLLPGLLESRSMTLDNDLRWCDEEDLDDEEDPVAVEADGPPGSPPPCPEGVRVPVTIRDLADTLDRLGVLPRTDTACGGRVRRTPDRLPHALPDRTAIGPPSVVASSPSRFRREVATLSGDFAPRFRD